jgi:pimeloyl-ACP methyl ester carboxylesterase
MKDYIDRRYLRTPSGLIHIRETGDGPILILAHGHPWAGDFWEPVMPEFTKAGYRTLAFDALGYGLSDRRGGPVSIEDQATVLQEVVGSLDQPIVGVAGWHQGSVVGLEFGIRDPKSCKALIFDGAGTATAAEAMILMARVGANNPTYPFEGNERTYWGDMIYGRLKIFDPHFELNQQNWPVFRTLLIDWLRVDPLLASGISPMMPDELRGLAMGHEFTNASAAVPFYPWPDKMKLIDIPVLVLSSEDEPLRPAHEAAIGGAKFGKEFIYPKGHPQMCVGREAEFVKPIVEFLKSLD